MRLKESQTPEDIYNLIPNTCEYVTLHGKWDFADVNKLGTLGWKAWIFWVSSMKSQVSLQMEERQVGKQKENVRIPTVATDFECEERGLWTRKVHRLWKLEKARK